MFLSRYLSPPILIAAEASFVIGLTATIEVIDWIKPILRYRLAKRRIADDLKRQIDGLRVKHQGSHSSTGKPRPGYHDIGTVQTVLNI